MKKSKFTEAQIAFTLQQAGSGTRVAEVYLKMGIRTMDEEHERRPVEILMRRGRPHSATAAPRASTTSVALA